MTFTSLRNALARTYTVFMLLLERFREKFLVIKRYTYFTSLHTFLQKCDLTATSVFNGHFSSEYGWPVPSWFLFLYWSQKTSRDKCRRSTYGPDVIPVT